MSEETRITVCGNLTGDPELRYTPSGTPVANFSIASTPRNFDRQTNEWRDGETLFLRCAVWRDQAENVASTLKRGDRVIATGCISAKSWEKDGQKKTGMEFDIDEIGPSLRMAAGQIHRTSGQNRQGGPLAAQSAPFQSSVPSSTPQAVGGPAAADPWAV